MHLATQGIWPLGAFTAGLLAESWGVCPVLWIGAVGGLASALWVLHPAIGRLQQRELNAREAAV
jgi:predicted MFS family arabinose efflux permease